MGLVDAFGVNQFIEHPTHVKSPFLDLVISLGLNIVNTFIAEARFPDIFLVLFELNIPVKKKNPGFPCCQRRRLSSSTALLFMNALDETEYLPDS